jgi:hypothetical protein
VFTSSVVDLVKVIVFTSSVVDLVKAIVFTSSVVDLVKVIVFTLKCGRSDVNTITFTPKIYHT